MEEVITNIKEVNNFVSTIFDNFVSTYGVNFVTRAVKLPQINYELSRKDSSGEAMHAPESNGSLFGCCQSFGYQSFRVDQTTQDDDIHYIADGADTNINFEKLFYINSNIKTAYTTVITKMIETNDLFKFQELVKDKILLERSPFNRYFNSSLKITTFVKDNAYLNDISDTDGVIRILEYWENKIKKYFPFHYEIVFTSKGKIEQINICLEYYDIPDGKHRMAAIELARAPFSCEAFYIYFAYYLNTILGVEEDKDNPLVEYWLAHMIVRAGIQNNILFQTNANSVFYSSYTIMNPIDKFIKNLKNKSYIAQAMKSLEASPAESFISKGGLIQSSIPSVLTSMLVKNLRNNKSSQFFIDGENYGVFVYKYFYYMLLKVFISNKDEFNKLFKEFTQ